jgi:hypothetical protein
VSSPTKPVNPTTRAVVSGTTATRQPVVTTKTGLRAQVRERSSAYDHLRDVDDLEAVAALLPILDLNVRGRPTIVTIPISDSRCRG